jgi:hypothetical protein
MDGHVCNYGAKSQEGGAINEPKDGKAKTQHKCQWKLEPINAVFH